MSDHRHSYIFEGQREMNTYISLLVNQILFFLLFSAVPNFFDTLNESAEKLLLHGSNFAKVLLQDGQVSFLTAVLGAMILARNHLSNYETILDEMGEIPDAPEEDPPQTSVGEQSALAPPGGGGGGGNEGDEVVAKGRPSLFKMVTDIHELVEAMTTQVRMIVEI